MPKGRIRESPDLKQDRSGEPGTASLRGNQIMEYRPDLDTIQDPAIQHALRTAYDYIYQLAGEMRPPKEEPDIPELAIPEANPFVPGGNGEPTPEQCELILGTVPPMVMSFLFGGENAFAPGDGFLYTGNQIQGRIEIIEYFNIPAVQPTEIGQYDFAGGFLNMRVAVWGDTMYVTNANRIELLDVLDRSNPTLIGSVSADFPDYILAFNQSINNLCLCKPILASISGTSDTLELFSLFDPESPSSFDKYPHLLDPPPEFGLASGINASKRGVLYTLSGDRISAFNISNPSDISKFGHIPAPPNYSFRSFYQSYGFGYLYIGTSADLVTGAINVYNVRNPSGMSLVSSIAVPGRPQSCSVDGSFLFVMYQPPGASRSQLAVYSLLSPTAPTLVTTIQMPTSGFYTYGLLTRDGAYVGHDHTTGAPVMAFFSIEYPPCCNCAPSLFVPGRF